MKKNKKIFAFITAAALAVSMTACGGSSENADGTADTGTLITFGDDGATIKGSGAQADGSLVTITAAGTYSLSGSSAAGQLVVDAGDDDRVTLIFDNIDITNEEDAAILVENADQAEIVLSEGSRNRLQSGVEKEIDLSVKDSSEEDASGGALRAKCDLNIYGSGTLTVLGYINNGIQSSDDILIDGGTIDVTAVNHGIKGNDSVTIRSGDITVTARQDGIHSDDRVDIADGNLTIASADDAIHADNELTIENGTIDITRSYEGLEADKVLISGGTIDLVSSDDGINATNGESAGFGPGGMGPANFELPEGIDMTDIQEMFQNFAETGELELPEGVELPEGFTTPGERGDMERGEMNPEDMKGRQGGFGGRGEMNPEDMNPEDMEGRQGGFGGRGGMNPDDMQGGFGGRANTSTDDLPEIRITGGTIIVNADGDGIDSNGNLYIEGGLVIVNGPANSANGALDYGSENGGECLVSGGTVLALGASGMAETFGSDSEQCSFICNLDSSFDAGDVLTITSEEGEVLFEQDIVKKGSSVVFSSPDLGIGDKVTLTVGDQSEEITLESVSTRVGGRSFGGFGGMRQ